jgi:protein-tyrosine phosphatase
MNEKKKNRLLFVCLGNICRSPLAEALMRQIQTGYNLNFELDSAGTSGFHKGEKPDARTRANALKNGLDISYLRARQFVSHDLSAFDRIYVMDRNNLSDIQNANPGSEYLHKLSLLPHPEKPGEFIEIPDPYYGTEADFQHVFQLLRKSVSALCKGFIKTD